MRLLIYHGHFWKNALKTKFLSFLTEIALGMDVMGEILAFFSQARSTMQFLFFEVVPFPFMQENGIISFLQTVAVKQIGKFDPNTKLGINWTGTLA